jgi:acetyl-CoA C-acetyltransferase
VITKKGDPRALDAAVPVIIGVGDVVQRPGDEMRDPLSLTVDAVVAAAEDAGNASVLASIDSIDVVSMVSWTYDDVANQLADHLGCSPRHTAYSDYGGHQPVRLVDAAAARIAAGECSVALVAGGEAMRTLETAMRAGETPPWPPLPADARPADPREHVTDCMASHDMIWPTNVYPLYEHPSRRAVGHSQSEARGWIGATWAAASAVASDNPVAWFREPRAAAEIANAGDSNRMVSWPYTKLMSALLSVDQAAAVIVASTDAARLLGVPEDRWVYPRGGAGAVELDDVLARSSFEATAAGGAALDGALQLGGLDAQEVDLVELYSCFPCVPRMAARHLGRSLDATTTVTGGLTFFGGPGNDYMLHAVAAMVRAIRGGRGAHGLLYGQGGYATKHHAMVLADRPANTYPVDDAVARQYVVDALVRPRLLDAYTGEGAIETLVMPYGRDGEPERVVIVGRAPTGDRFVARMEPTGDAVAVLTDPDEEPLGRPVRVEESPDGLGHAELV